MTQGKKLMKSTATLLFAMLISEVISGQQVFDVLLKAKALNESGSPDQTIALLEPHIKNTPESRLYLTRGEALMIKGDYLLAASDFDSANSITGSSGDYGLARIFAIRGDAQKSLAHLGNSMKSPFRRSEKEIMLDPAFSKLENTPEWRQFWKTDWYSDHEKIIPEIEYYLNAGKINEALVLLSGLEKDFPGNAETLYIRALYFTASGKNPDAVKILTSLTNEDPSNVVYLRALTKAQIAGSNFAGASNSITKLFKLEVTDAELLLQRASCYNKTGEYNRAADDIKTYLSLYPQNKDALSLAGKVASATGDNLKALEYYSQNIKLNPGFPECYNDRAGAYSLSRSWSMAISDYTMSLDLYPGNSDVWLSKGIALVNLGKTEDACHDFRRSFNLGNKKATEYISRHCIK